jgi:hypothetical protein
MGRPKNQSLSKSSVSSVRGYAHTQSHRLQREQRLNGMGIIAGIGDIDYRPSSPLFGTDVTNPSLPVNLADRKKFLSQALIPFVFTQC